MFTVKSNVHEEASPFITFYYNQPGKDGFGLLDGYGLLLSMDVAWTLYNDGRNGVRNCCGCYCVSFCLFVYRLDY
jgi:hypothetical protein